MSRSGPQKTIRVTGEEVIVNSAKVLSVDVVDPHDDPRLR